MTIENIKVIHHDNFRQYPKTKDISDHSENAYNFQKLNRNGMKNAEKELIIRSIAPNIQKIHEKINAILI